MKKKAIIFDMDGVIIDSEPFWQDAQKEALLLEGVSICVEDCERLTMGKRIDEVAKTWCETYHLTLDPKTLEQRILTRLCERISTQGKAMKGFNEILVYFKEAGYKIALATSSTHEVIQVVFDKLALWDGFDVICSAEDEQYGKPHPDVYLSAARELALCPDECIVIEDSFTGLCAAKNAHMTTYLVSPHYKDPRFLYAEGQYENLPALMHDFACFFTNDQESQ